jgi:hypothetical protein
MLSPTKYINDCLNIFDHLIDSHSCPNLVELKSKQSNTIKLWVNELAISFNFTNQKTCVDPSEFATFHSKLSYNLAHASERQKNFYYNVSLPHYRLKCFVEHIFEQYKKYLYFKHLYPNEVFVPGVAADLVWHTHQLSPKAYAHDTKKIVGFVMAHDNEDSDKTPGSPMYNAIQNTKNRWMEIYREEFFDVGGMKRGDRPGKPKFSFNNGYLIYQKLNKKYI